MNNWTICSFINLHMKYTKCISKIIGNTYKEIIQFSNLFCLFGWGFVHLFAVCLFCSLDCLLVDWFTLSTAKFLDVLEVLTVLSLKNTLSAEHLSRSDFQLGVQNQVHHMQFFWCGLWSFFNNDNNNNFRPFIVVHFDTELPTLMQL